MATAPALTCHDLVVRAVNVPMRRPLATSGGIVGVAPLVLLDLVTEQGPVGSAYLFCYTPLVLEPVLRLLQNLAPVLKGRSAAPLDLDRRLQHSRRYREERLRCIYPPCLLERTGEGQPHSQSLV